MRILARFVSIAMFYRIQIDILQAIDEIML